MWVILLREEPPLGVGHLAEVILDELGEVLRGLNLVVWAAEGAIAGGGGNCGGGDGGVGSLLAGKWRGAYGRRGGGALLFTDGFGSEAVDFLDRADA